MDTQKIVHFIFELGQLKREPRSGWTLMGKKDVETVSEHACRAAQVAYILAVMEKHENPERVAFMVLIHDNHETRTRDPHKLVSRYVSMKDAEHKAFADQLELLGGGLFRKNGASISMNMRNVLLPTAL